MSRHCRCLLVSVISLVFGAALPAANANAQADVSALQSQPLVDAFEKFAKSSGYQLVYRTDVAAGLMTKGVGAGLSAEETLRQLLEGTDLSFMFINDRTIAIYKSLHPLPRRSPIDVPTPESSLPPAEIGGDNINDVGVKTVAHKGSLFRKGFLARISGILATLIGSVAGAADGVDPAAPAQPTQAVAQQNDKGGMEEVMVTGSRIIRDGYEAPTPVAVLGTEDLKAMAVPNIVDAVNRMPNFAPVKNSRNSSANDQDGGVQTLDLRGLGSTRTLVLLDGKRVVSAILAGYGNVGGSTDINVFPNGLISRVDVVTGGASAAYGSDALAGVVNFVLDKDFTGVKGEALGGLTNYGDDATYKVTLTAGTPFADGRGHFLISGEDSYVQGIKGKNRPWDRNGYMIIGNPDYAPGNGLPQYLTAFNTGLAIATPGGLVLGDNVNGAASPFRGIAFGPGGKPGPFTFGRVNGLIMIGGDLNQSRVDNNEMMDLNLRRTNAFSRVSYDVVDNATVYGEALWSTTRSRLLSGVPQFQLGNINIESGNPFIPASVQQQMTAQGVASLNIGSTVGDLPFFSHDNVRETRRFVGGIKGTLDALGTKWSWDAYYEGGQTHASVKTPGDVLQANLIRAEDAVINPNNGKIVCRSTLTNPGDGCVPFNAMGTGVNSQSAVDYVTGTGYSVIRLGQDVFAASASGEPLSTWAGPVSVAFGVEHRRETVRSSASALDEARAYFAGNFTASHGQYTVTEGFAETVIPLAKDASWAKSFDLNAAARATDYSTAGYVTTWKAGATYAPISDIKFRVTRSRDIRAPNLSDLFNAGRSGTVSITDPATGIATTVAARTQGNPNLTPEKADTTGVGVVFSPTWLRGFGASIDFYNIQIKDAISTLNPQQYVDRCFAGQTALCAFIERDSNNLIDFVAVQPANVLSQNARGIDFEASYNLPLSNIYARWSGDIAVRGLLSYLMSLETVDDKTTIQGAGVNSDRGSAFGPASGLYAPHMKYLVSVTYSNGPISGTVTARGVGSGKYNNALVQCASACPISTDTNPTIDNNHIKGVTYFDLELGYKLFDEKAELFFAAENALNTAPAFVAGDPSQNFYNGQGATAVYDTLGRIFRAGFRFKL
ncbi:MAG: TonB-dependent receptor [Proteobacteria bacterium]|nr:TonB-dependent receptor [Pseudomonadota bacterium]